MVRPSRENEEDRGGLKILTSTPTGKRPLGRRRRKWKNIIKMGLKEIGVNTSNWVDSAQGRDKLYVYAFPK